MLKSALKQANKQKTTTNVPPPGYVFPVKEEDGLLERILGIWMFGKLSSSFFLSFKFVDLFLRHLYVYSAVDSRGCQTWHWDDSAK